MQTLEPQSQKLKCYVINLDRSKDRLAQGSQTFHEKNLTFERVEAVDGALLDDEHVEHLTSRRHWPYPLSRGEIGCFLSHRECLRRIIESNDAWGVVFEDDIIISPDIGILLQDTRWIPEGTDIVKLDTMMGESCSVGRMHRIPVAPPPAYPVLPAAGSACQYTYRRCGLHHLQKMCRQAASIDGICCCTHR